jgi:hypothetical protein
LSPLSRRSEGEAAHRTLRGGPGSYGLPANCLETWR